MDMLDFPVNLAIMMKDTRAASGRCVPDPILNLNWSGNGSGKALHRKELSWLSFNERVLQEAADKSNPLIERMRFLGIYSNNLDEFYKVRFADLKRRILISEEQGSAGASRHLLKRSRPRC